jgi:ABC-type nitrate/sulfonate/bicarbonate transport system permease component
LITGWIPKISIIYLSQIILKKNQMKKAFLVAVLALVFISCSNTTTSVESTQVDSTLLNVDSTLTVSGTVVIDTLEVLD